MAGLIHQKDRLDQNPIEVLVADIRNKLTPFWVLLDIIKLQDQYPNFDIKEHAQVCETQKKLITDSLHRINQISIRIENETEKKA